MNKAKIQLIVLMSLTMEGSVSAETGTDFITPYSDSGNESPAPATASFNYVAVDKIVRFTDTSDADADIVSGRSWEFNESGQEPVVSHTKIVTVEFVNPGTHEVCLTVSNSTGKSPKLCQPIVIMHTPSTTHSDGGIDFDDDGTDDVNVFAACGRTGLNPINGAGYAILSVPFLTVTSADIPSNFNTDSSGFCPEGFIGNLQQTILIETAGGQVFKVWSLKNTSEHIRIQSLLLNNAA